MPSCVYLRHRRKEKGSEPRIWFRFMPLIGATLILNLQKMTISRSESPFPIIRLRTIGLPSLKLQSGPNVQSTGINVQAQRNCPDLSRALILNGNAYFQGLRQFFINFTRRKNNDRQYCLSNILASNLSCDLWNQSFKTIVSKWIKFYIQKIWSKLYMLEKWQYDNRNNKKLCK